MNKLAYLNIYSIVENPSKPPDEDDDDDDDGSGVDDAHNDGKGSGWQKD